MAGIAGFAVVSGSALPLLSRRWPRTDVSQPRPAKHPLSAPGPLLEYAEEKRRDERQLSDMFQEIPPEMRLRYADLDKICNAIRANYSSLSSTSQMFAQQMEDRLQGLLQAYVRLLHAALQHREYLRTTDLRVVKRELAQLQKEQESDSPKVQEINRKRIEILTKRVEKFKKIRENCEVIDAQCAAVEDVLALIRDQSVTMRDPQQLSDHLDDLVQDVEQTEETVREVEAIFEMSPISAGWLREASRRSLPVPAAPVATHRRRTACGTNPMSGPTTASPEMPDWARSAFGKILLAHALPVRAARQRARPGATRSAAAPSNTFLCHLPQ